MYFARIIEFFRILPLRLTLGFLLLYAFGTALIFSYLNFRFASVGPSPLARFFVAVEAAVLVTLLGLMLASWLAWKFHGRIQAFNMLTMQIIKSGDLSARMPITGQGELATLAVNMNSMLERLDKLVQGMRQVSDNIAHDLRSPLTRLHAAIEVALRSDDPDLHRATLERALLELKGMESLFNSLLSISRAEAGGRQLKRKTINLSELLDEIVELYSPSAEEHNLELHPEIPVALEIQGDRQLLAQAFSNILDNAIKYVPSGGGIWVRAEKRGVRVEVTIEDNGPGIPEDMREKIFDRFSRIDPSRTLPGAGLGLALARAFIELHHGSVAVNPSEKGGAAFLIRLPIS